MAKSRINVNDLLINTWKKMYKDPVFPEYRPLKETYTRENGTVKGYRSYLKENRLNDFVFDLAFYPETLKIYVEINGSGQGHSGPGATRDLHKHNQSVFLGWVGLYYPALEVKNHPDIICEEIKCFMTTRKSQLSRKI